VDLRDSSLHFLHADPLEHYTSLFMDPIDLGRCSGQPCSAHAARLPDTRPSRLSRPERAHRGVPRGDALLGGKRFNGRPVHVDRFENGGALRLQRVSQAANARTDVTVQIIQRKGHRPREQLQMRPVARNPSINRRTSWVSSTWRNARGLRTGTTRVRRDVLFYTNVCLSPDRYNAVGRSAKGISVEYLEMLSKTPECSLTTNGCGGASLATK
jgi:hypothetical protein